MSAIPVLQMFIAALVLLRAAPLVAVDEAFPSVWDGDQPRMGPWSLCQVWPDRGEQGGNYIPLSHRGSAWTAEANSAGGCPSITLDQGGMTIMARGNWGGSSDPGARIAGVVYTAAADGVYRITVQIEVKRGTGGGPNFVRLVTLPKIGENTPSAPRYGDKSAWLIKPHPRQVESVRFRRAAPEPISLDRAVYLVAGESLALIPAMADNNAVSIRVRDLRVAYTPAASPPVDATDGILPRTPRPPVDDPLLVAERGGEQRRFPDDANVIDVTKPPYNAVGDGRTDCTWALQRAIDQGGVIWLPNGVYIISDQLRYTAGARVPSRTTLHGESIVGTVIKLKDRTPDFSDPLQPLSMLWVSRFPPQAFRNHVRFLTLDSGRGNPGAIGCQFYANNQGSIEDVRIRSGDGAGVFGLDLGFDNDQGPMLARGIEVIGFDTGIRTARQTTVTTLADIVLRDQRKVGWLNDLHAIAVRNLHSTNSVTALSSPDPGGHVVLIDSELVGTGAALQAPAIANAGGMFVRNLRTSGYASAITSNVGKEPATVAGPSVDEWTSHPVLTLWNDAPRRSLGLRIQDPPYRPWDPLPAWASVKAYTPATVDTGTTYRGKSITYTDWTPALRQAMASGKPTVYFPKGSYVIDGEVEIPSTVKRLIGIESSFDHVRGKAVLIVKDGADPLIIERFDWNYSKVVIQHQGNRPIYFANIIGSSYRPDPGAGDVWFDDICQGGLRFVPGQHVWARQLNPEYGDKPHVLNRGADLWVLGMKTEGYSTIIATSAKGRTELLGGMLYANQGREAQPAFINEAGTAFSASVSEWILRSCNFFEVVVESREGQPFRVLRSEVVPKRGDPTAKQLGGYGTSMMIPLFSGWRPANDGDRP